MAPLRRLKIPASVQDWFSVAIAIGHDRTIRLVLELDGTLDFPRLSRAMELVVEAEPLLACRFVPRPFRAYWGSREDHRNEEACTLLVTDDIPRDLHAYMAQSVDPEKDPLLQMCVFRSARDTLCIKVSHAAMDGGGFKFLVRRLTAEYRALAVNPSAVPSLDLASDRGQGQVLRPIPLRARLRAFLTQPFHKKTWSFPYTDSEPSDFTFSSRAVDLPVPALREAAKRRGATITDALIAGWARALFDLTDTPADVSIPSVLAMDLRRYLPSPDAAGLCNLSSLAWMDLYRRPGAAIDQTIREVHGALVEATRDYPGVGLAMVMEITSVLGSGAFIFLNEMRARMARRQAREFPSLSNIGMMDPDVINFGDTRVRQARFFSPVIYPPTFSLVCGSFEDTMYFTASYPRSVVPGNLVERLLDRIVAEIDSLR